MLTGASGMFSDTHFNTGSVQHSTWFGTLCVNPEGKKSSSLLDKESGAHRSVARILQRSTGSFRSFHSTIPSLRL